MDRKVHRTATLLLLLLITLVSFSCTGHRPELQRTFWQLDVYRNPRTGEQYERLSVFAVARDLDGGEDLETWILRMPEEELVWERNLEALRRVGGGEDTWTGSNSFAMPFDDQLPRGEYLLRIEDRAGEQGEATFSIPRDLIGLTQGELEAELFPRLRFEEGRALVSSPYEVHSFSVSDGNGEIVEVMETGEAVIPSATLEEWRDAGAEQLFLGAFHEELGVGLKSGPYRLSSSSDLPATGDESPAE
jgi:hypothetical protein